jgi:hypothetical protein
MDFSVLDDGVLPSPLTGTTWAITSGAAANTPTESAEKFTDGGLEDWATATDLTSWAETLAGTSTVNQETSDVHGGSNAARLDIDASNSNAIVAQTPVLTLGDWVVVRGWAKSEPTAKSLITTFSNNVGGNGSQTLTDEYAEFARNGIYRVAAGMDYRVNKQSAASSSLYIDDLSMNVLTRSTLVASFDAGEADLTVKADWTIIRGTHAGVIMNVDDPALPQNWVALVHAGGINNLLLIKCVNGTITQVALQAPVTYVEGATVELRKSGSTYQMYYNSVKIGSDQTISDASIVDNTIHGLISCYPENTCDFFSVAQTA